MRNWRLGLVLSASIAGVFSFADIPAPEIFFVCRCVFRSFADPHGFFRACRLPLHFDPFAADLIAPSFHKPFHEFCRKYL